MIDISSKCLFTLELANTQVFWIDTPSLQTGFVFIIGYERGCGMGRVQFVSFNGVTNEYR